MRLYLITALFFTTCSAITFEQLILEEWRAFKVSSLFISKLLWKLRTFFFSFLKRYLNHFFNIYAVMKNCRFFMIHNLPVARYNHYTIRKTCIILFKCELFKYVYGGYILKRLIKITLTCGFRRRFEEF